MKKAAMKPQSPGGRTFDDAMRRLVHVPKAELDKEEAKYLAMRKRLRDKKAKRKSEK